MDTITPLKKASFEIVGTNVADIGARLTLTNRLIREGVEWCSIENIGTKKIVVMLAGGKEDIERYREIIKKNFEKWLIEDIDEEERVQKKIGNPGIRYTELVYDDGLSILSIDRHTHALQCQQLRKGVNVFTDLNTTFKEFSEVNKKSSEVNKELLKYLKRVNKQIHH
jgi:hypothetical protein